LEKHSQHKTKKFYAFPPFTLISRTLQKIIEDEACGILVFPYWPSQFWFPVLKSLLMEEILFFPPSNDALLSIDSNSHPLASSLTLAAAKLSGTHTQHVGSL
jgi:hypothetical protein